MLKRACGISVLAMVGWTGLADAVVLARMDSRVFMDPTATAGDPERTAGAVCVVGTDFGPWVDPHGSRADLTNGPAGGPARIAESVRVGATALGPWVDPHALRTEPAYRILAAALRPSADFGLYIDPHAGAGGAIGITRVDYRSFMAPAAPGADPERIAGPDFGVLVDPHGSRAEPASQILASAIRLGVDFGPYIDPHA
ncbi:MAG: hypothetical protein GY835_02805 [bacterium]|nr:hypothetical protein [bacterium]